MHGNPVAVNGLLMSCAALVSIIGSSLTYKYVQWSSIEIDVRRTQFIRFPPLEHLKL